MIQSVDENSDLYFLHQKTDSECTPEFPEELNQKICRIVGQESYRPSKIFQRQVIKFNINDKNNRKGHTLSSRSVNVSMFLSYFENKPDYRFLEISVKRILASRFGMGAKCMKITINAIPYIMPIFMNLNLYGIIYWTAFMASKSMN